jgi:hypothetical protein
MRKHKLADLKDFAFTKGGKVLCNNYINSSQPITWECSKGHQWQACWGSVNNSKSWCPRCAGQSKPDIIVLQCEAAIKGGKLISQDYKNNQTPLIWECSKGHQWSSCWGNISRKTANTWCPICANNIKKDIKVLQNFAAIKKGKLISTSYTNSHVKLEWLCESGHTWFANWSDIYSKNSWCPYCKKYKTELECKQVIEQLTGKQFNKCRIIPFNNSKLELDGYNEELKLAFEYNGIQHYKLCAWFHKTKEDFEYQKEKDSYKKQWCLDNGIKLIVIPYTELNNLNQYIEREIKLWQLQNHSSQQI